MSEWEWRVFWRTGLVCPNPMLGHQQQRQSNEAWAAEWARVGAQYKPTPEQQLEQARLMQNANPPLLPPEPSDEVRDVMVSWALRDTATAYHEAVWTYLVWLGLFLFGIGLKIIIVKALTR